MIAHRELDAVRNARLQRLGYVQVALAELRMVVYGTENLQPGLQAELTAGRWDPDNACLTPSVRRYLDHNRPADRLKGQANAKMGPVKLHRHLARDATDVGQLDTDLGRLARHRRVGPHVDLGFGKEGVPGPVQWHRRCVELSETTDQLTVNIPLHIDDDIPAAQQTQRRGDDQRRRARFIWVQRQ